MTGREASNITKNKGYFALNLFTHRSSTKIRFKHNFFRLRQLSSITHNQLNIHNYGLEDFKIYCRRFFNWFNFVKKRFSYVAELFTIDLNTYL